MVGSAFLHREQATDFNAYPKVDQFSEQQPPKPSVDESTKVVGAITADDHDPHPSSNLAVNINQGSPPRSTFGYIRHSIADTLGGARDAYRMVKGGLISSPLPPSTSENTRPPR